MSLTLTSTAFENGNEIPSVHTCDGKNISPPLAWSGLPPGTKSLALIVDDPDAPDPAAPQRTWAHWVVYNIPTAAPGLAEDAERNHFPKEAQQGLNDWKNPSYGGPCPPIGRHRYFHKLYALDVMLPPLGKINKAALEKAMHGHVLGQAQLIGTYQRD